MMNRGQMTLVNLLALLMTFIIYIALVPMLNAVIGPVVVSIQATPNDFTPILVLALNAVPFVLLLAIILTAFQYAIPRTDQSQG